MKLPPSPLLVLGLTTLGLSSAVSAQATYPRDRILVDEITAKASDAKTAYDVVARLRPQFLRPRPSGSIQNRNPVPVHVFIDGGYRGGVEVLRTILANSVLEIAYLNGTDATTRFGTGYESGAILVTTGRRPPG